VIVREPPKAKNNYFFVYLRAKGVSATSPGDTFPAFQRCMRISDIGPDVPHDGRRGPVVLAGEPLAICFWLTSPSASALERLASARPRSC